MDQALKALEFLTSDEYTKSQEIITLLKNKKDTVDELTERYFSTHTKKCNDHTKKLMKEFLRGKLESYCLAEHLYKSKCKCGCNP